MLQIAETVSLEDVKKELLEFCLVPHGADAILQHIQIEVNKYNYQKYVLKLMEQRYLTAGSSRNRNALNKTFIITQKGLNYLKAIS